MILKMKLTDIRVLDYVCLYFCPSCAITGEMRSLERLEQSGYLAKLGDMTVGGALMVGLNKLEGVTGMDLNGDGKKGEGDKPPQA